MAVLGLSDPDDGDWARLRGLQYSSLRSGTFSRIATQVAAMLAIVTLTMEQVPVVFMAGWITVVALTLWHGQRIDRSLADADRRRMSRGEVQAQMVASIFSGLVWAVPLGCFGLFVDAATQVKIWTVLAMLMTASAILLPAVPMGTLLFCG
ncbi:MAG TPA: diguanylate cyclase, partial [Erythrobacter sp.]|nr:diguanylate cyclase [Erythrobacter sp.]